MQDAFGTRFVLYPWNRSNLLELLRREYDRNEMEAMSLLVHEGDTALDVGANVGTYSVYLSRLCGPRGKVFAFEPVEETFWELCETLALNRCENVVPVRAAVSNRTAHATMNLFEPRFSPWNTFGMPCMTAPDGSKVKPSKSVQVPTITLDEFCEPRQIEKVDFLKVDVEGFEASVFEGAEKFFREHRIGTVCFEVSQAPLRGANAKSCDAFRALERHGYKAYLFSAKTRAFEGPVHDSAEEFANFFASCSDLAQAAHQVAPARAIGEVMA